MKAKDKVKLGLPVDMSRPLTAAQMAVVTNIAEHQMPTAAAAAAAGVSRKGAEEMLRNPRVKAALAERRAMFAAAAQVTRKKVVDGFMEAIDMARTKADPLSMISGWREVGKICGLYEPTKTQVQVSVNGRVVVDRLNAMSDAELLQLSTGEVDVIEGEARLLPETEESDVE